MNFTSLKKLSAQHLITRAIGSLHANLSGEDGPLKHQTQEHLSPSLPKVKLLENFFPKTDLLFYIFLVKEES